MADRHGRRRGLDRRADNVRPDHHGGDTADLRRVRDLPRTCRRCALGHGGSSTDCWVGGRGSFLIYDLIERSGGNTRAQANDDRTEATKLARICSRRSRGTGAVDADSPPTEPRRSQAVDQRTSSPRHTVSAARVKHGSESAQRRLTSEARTQNGWYGGAVSRTTHTWVRVHCDVQPFTSPVVPSVYWMRTVTGIGSPWRMWSPSSSPANRSGACSTISCPHHQCRTNVRAARDPYGGHPAASEARLECRTGV